MKTAIHDHTAVTKRIEVQFPYDDVTNKETESLKEIARTATIRGFRKGKAPTHVVRNLFGAEVRKDTLKHFMSLGLEEALKTLDFDIVAVNDMTPAPFKDGDPFIFSFIVEIVPRLEKVVYEDIEIEAPRIGISDADVERRIEELRNMHAEVRNLDSPRPAGKGDLTTLGIALWKDGIWMPQGPEQGHEVIVGQGTMPEALENALVGKSVGDIFELEMPHSQDEVHSRYQISVRDIRERRCPALDDEFAKDVGAFETLDVLRDTIRKQLEEIAKRNSEMSLRNRIMEKLREKNPMDLPPSMVEEKLEESARMLGISLAKLPPDGEAITTLTKMATDAVHWTLLLREVRRLEEIVVDDAEIDTFIRAEAETTSEPLPKVRARLQKEGGLERVRFNLMEDKIFEKIKSCIMIVQPQTKGESSHA